MTELNAAMSQMLQFKTNPTKLVLLPLADGRATPVYIAPHFFPWEYGEISSSWIKGYFEPLTVETARAIGWIETPRENALKVGDWYVVQSEKDLPQDHTRMVETVLERELDAAKLDTCTDGSPIRLRGHEIDSNLGVVLWRYAKDT